MYPKLMLNIANRITSMSESGYQILENLCVARVRLTVICSCAGTTVATYILIACDVVKRAAIPSTQSLFKLLAENFQIIIQGGFNQFNLT